MAFADPIRVRADIYALLGRPSMQTLPPKDVDAARIASGMEILRAVSRNTGHGFYGAMTTLVTVANNAYLPAHDGEPGIPVIVPFLGAAAREGIPADPDEIDAYRNDSLTRPSFSGTLDGVAIPHDQADADGKMAPTALRYSLVNKRLKFTGLTCQVPLVQISRAMADSGVPENYEATIVKLSLLRLVQPGNQYYQRALGYAAEGHNDLIEIQNGSMNVKPVMIPAVAIAQKLLI